MSGSTFPPSFSDCQLKDEYREEIEAIADCLYYGVQRDLKDESRQTIDHWARVDDLEEECVEMAEDLGMEVLDSGVSRLGFAVVPDPEPSEPNPDGPTAFEQCVFKFSRFGKSNLKDGREQTRQEIENYLSLPDSLTEGEGDRAPVFNPLRDYDDDDYLWLTQPYCPPPGNQSEVEDRMRVKGWRASDLHADNVGSYPTLNQSAVIDYGLNVEEFGKDIDAEMDQIENAVRQLDGWEITREQFDQGGGEVQFWPDKDLPGQEEPSQQSHVRVDKDGLVTQIEVFFPGFDQEMFSRTEMNQEMSKMDYQPDVRGVQAFSYVDYGRDYVGANIQISAGRADPLPPDMAVDMYEDLINAYNSHFNQYVTTGETGTGSPATAAGVAGIQNARDFDDIERQWKNALEDIGMRNVLYRSNGARGTGPSIQFHAPTDNTPHPSPQRSSLWLTSPAAVKEIRYNAAEISLTANTRPGVRVDAIGVGQTIGEEFENATATGTIALKTSDPVGTGDLYNIVYKVSWVGNFMAPQEAVDVLDRLTGKHNAVFEKYR